MFAAVTHIDVGLLNFVGAAVPLLVGLVTKWKASARLKAIFNLGLSAIAGAVATAIQSKGSVDATQWFVGIGTTWGISILSYYGLWKPTGTAQTVESKTANIGVGPSSTPVEVAVAKEELPPVDAPSKPADMMEPDPKAAKPKKKPKPKVKVEKKR